MIIVDNERTVVVGEMCKVLGDLASAMAEIRNTFGKDYAKEDVDELLHEAVDLSGKSAEQLLEYLREQLKELFKDE